MTVEVKTFDITDESCCLSDCRETLHETSNIFWKANLQRKNDKNLVESPVYKLNAGTQNESEWKVYLNPGHVDDNGTKYMSIYLQMLRSSTDVEMSFSVTLPDDSQRFESGIKLFSTETPLHGFDKFLLLYRVQSDSIKEHNLELNVALHIIGRKDLMEEVDTKTLVSSSDKSVTFNITQSDPLPEIETDATISNGRYILPVNSRLLSACSPMFEQFFRENGTNNITLDVSNTCPSSQVLKMVVQFCHFGTLKLPKLDVVLCNLMDVARKLEIKSLMAKAQELFLKKMTIPKFDLAVKLVVSDVLDASIANPILSDFLMANFDELKCTDIFEETLETYLDYYKILLMVY